MVHSKDKRQREGQRQGAPAFSEEERRLLSTNWPIVVVFGQSGAGKSTFINLIAKEKQKVGTGVDTCTTRVQFVEARIRGNPIVIVDTPSTDDNRPGETEADGLATIASGLELTGRDRKWVTGILYLHRITETRFTPTARRFSEILVSLCGESEMKRVTFCTTMWDLPSSSDATRRHGQLCEHPKLKEMISEGASTATHSNDWNNATANAEKILSDLIGDLKPGALAIQNEMIKEGKKVSETRAGQVVVEHLAKEQAQTDREIRELRQQIIAERGENAVKLAKELAAQESRKKELERQEQQLNREAKCSNCIIC